MESYLLRSMATGSFFEYVFMALCFLGREVFLVFFLSKYTVGTYLFVGTMWPLTDYISQRHAVYPWRLCEENLDQIRYFIWKKAPRSVRIVHEERRENKYFRNNTEIRVIVSCKGRFYTFRYTK